MSISQIGTPTEFDSSATSGASASATRTVAAGSMLVLVTQGTATLTTPSGWTLAKKQTCTDAPSYQTNIYYQTGSSAGSLSVTINRTSGTGSFRCTLSEWSGMGAATVDKTSGYGGYGTGSGSAFPTTGTLTGAVNLAIAGFYAAASAGDTLTGPSGWNVVSTSNSPFEYMVCSLATSSSAALAPYWSPPVNVENANALVVFKPGALPPAAVLSSPDKNTVTAYAANATVTSSVTGGVLYAVATQTNTQPLPDQIEAGLDRAGFASPNGNTSGASGSNSIALTGLSANTTYYVWLLQDNGSLSNVPTVSFTTLPPPPVVTSVDNMSPRYQGSLTINYENGGSSTGTVTIGGVSQTITSWTSLQAVIGSVARGANKYGTPLDVVVSSAIGSPSAPFALTQLQPQTGWGFTNLGTPITPDTERVTTSSTDLVASDQIAWEASVATMYPDGSASAPNPVSWACEAWTSGSGWGSQGTLTIQISGTGGGSTFVADFFGAAASTIGAVFGASVSTLSRAF